WGVSLVVLRGPRRLPPRRWLVRESALQMADPGLSDCPIEEMHHAAHVLDVRVIDPPLDADLALAEAVRLVAQHHAVVVAEPGLEGSPHSPAPPGPMRHGQLARHGH